MKETNTTLTAPVPQLKSRADAILQTKAPLR
jgi:hypothetical protein